MFGSADLLQRGVRMDGNEGMKWAMLSVCRESNDCQHIGGTR